MSLFLFWLLCSLAAACAIISTEVYEHYHPSHVKELTWMDALFGLSLALCPVVNIIMCFAAFVYFYERKQ